ncbi:hypothetical protein NQ317_003185 [Molorchus minor]|uniref:CCHC-type domain-containing protein n=1 Tax=Molorchus minor TaxID=1323400 RepID=A0ABQ9JGS2_9CUCU|nr:hypothetical protein NQ317_003185 [Molorchus minor]
MKPIRPPLRKQDVVVWCNKIDELREVFHRSEETTTYYALARFKGLAEVWYRSLESVKYSWAEWKEKLKRAFSIIGRDDEAQENSLEKLIRATILKSCPYSIFVGIFLAVKLYLTIMSKRLPVPGTIASQRDYSPIFRTLQTTNFRPKGSKWENRKVSETKSRQTSELSRSTEVKCFKCGKTGHKSFQCKLNGNKVRSFCHKKGHEESRCFFKRDGKSTTSKEYTL